MGDGFELSKQNSFDDIAGDVAKRFERDSVLGEYYAYFNFVRANVVSEEAGIDGFGREASTALGGRVLEQTVAGLCAVDHVQALRYLDELAG